MAEDHRDESLALRSVDTEPADRSHQEVVVRVDTVSWYVFAVNVGLGVPPNGATTAAAMAMADVTTMRENSSVTAARVAKAIAPRL